MAKRRKTYPMPAKLRARGAGPPAPPPLDEHAIATLRRMSAPGYDGTKDPEGLSLDAFFAMSGGHISEWARASLAAQPAEDAAARLAVAKEAERLGRAGEFEAWLASGSAEWPPGLWPGDVSEPSFAAARDELGVSDKTLRRCLRNSEFRALDAVSLPLELDGSPPRNVDEAHYAARDAAVDRRYDPEGPWRSV